MTYATLAGVRRGHREQQAAIKRAVEVFGEPLSLSANSSNGRDFLEFESYATDKVWAKHATWASVHVGTLVEFRRPLAISKDSWVWKSDFVKVSLAAIYPFNIFWHEGARQGVDGGKIEKAGLRPFAMAVRVSGGRNYGLEKWAEHRKTLTKWAAEFSDDKVRQSVLRGVESADNAIAEFRKAVADLSANAGITP